MEDYQFYHIYLRGNHKQDFFYKKNDYINVINRLALAAYHTSTKIWALEYLSNHFHLVIETKDRSAFMHYYRLSITQWYNHEYGGNGSIGGRHHGWGRITNPSEDGGEDLKDAISYTLRNCKKHGILDDFYNYPWSTIRLYYNKRQNSTSLISKREASAFFPIHAIIPDHYRIDKSGMIVPQDFINVQGVEKLFGTIENFKNALSKPSRREINNQTDLERLKATIPRHNAQKPILDIVISEEILAHLDLYSQKYRNAPRNILQMTFDEKILMAKYIKKQYPRCSVAQLARILLVPDSTLRRHIHHTTRVPRVWCGCFYIPLCHVLLCSYIGVCGVQRLLWRGEVVLCTGCL